MSNNSSKPTNAPPQSDPSIVPIVSELEELFRRLNEQFFESALSKPVITVSPDPQRKDRKGWCSTRRVWTDVEDWTYFEVNLCAEFLNRPIEEIGETLLHNMVHQLNTQNEIKDTSRGGTYHNESFKVAAEEHGLVTAKSMKYGYSETALAPDAQDFIRSLSLPQFDLFRENRIPVNPESPITESPARRPTSTRKYACPKCSAQVRATKDLQILCVPCEEPFMKAQ